MFESLTEKIEKVIKNIKGEGRITESNISDIIRDVRLALLEADVNYKVVKEFTDNVKEKALGEEVKSSLKPAELFLKILKDELLIILGNEDNSLVLNRKPSVIMLVGLQGSGKTTTVAKLGNLLKKKENKKVMFIAADTYRPAAIDQLITLGKELDIYVYNENTNPVLIVENGIKYAKENNYDVIIIDTAGRLHIDEVLMQELNNIINVSNPNEILLVIDAMIGQDAINVINGFNDKLKLTGTILTKMDSNTKGGVALSVKHLTNIPIKYVGNSEKIDGLTLFDKERMVSRILGDGDILSIIEKAEEAIDKDEAEKVAKKLQKGNMDLDDFLSQLKQIKRMGPLENILKMLPGASKLGLNNISVDPKQISKIEAIISSMTLKERKDPDIIKASRKIRIADGSGTKVEDVNKLLKQFEQMKQMLKMFKNGNLKLPF
ncbi:MAG TPA: signal recognition particle protein [Bacilli bacterium]|nr:signal recognition particle protein [Bacilli bacterium]